VPLYEELYGKRTWLADAEKRRVEAPLRRLAQRYVPELAERFQRCSEDLGVVRGGPPPLEGADRRFRGYALAEDGRPPHFASPRGAPRRPATAAEVATGRAADPRDAVEASEARRAAPVQDALF
jgi:hypothetical protein